MNYTLYGNKLIAEFMGMEIVSKNEIDIWVKTDFHNGIMEETNACFHHSWDWLMSVIDKIEAMGFEFSLQKRQCQVFDKSKKYPDNFIIDADFQNTKIDNAFQAVVAFVEIYNSKKSS